MTFEELEKRWISIRKNLPFKYIKMLSTLFLSRDEVQVHSSFDLLISLDESALCEILHNEYGSIGLKRKVFVKYYVSTPHLVQEQNRILLLWQECVLQEVIHKESVWHELYMQRSFRELAWHVYNNFSLVNMSEVFREEMRKESLRSVEVPAGNFMMGAQSTVKDARDIEKPAHKVTLTEGLHVCIYACTQALYIDVMGINPSQFRSLLRPVEHISWLDAIVFCNKLSQKERLDPCYELPDSFEDDDDWVRKVQWNREANGYRLPTEAEWEYCARGNQDMWFSGGQRVYEVAWYGALYGGKIEETQPVGGKKPNGFGLYDMSGNVWEWCWDSCFRKYEHDVVDPIYVDPASSYRVVKGGAWCTHGSLLRIFCRSLWSRTYERNNDVGLRLVRNLL